MTDHPHALDIAISAGLVLVGLLSLSRPLVLAVAAFLFGLVRVVVILGATASIIWGALHPKDDLAGTMALYVCASAVFVLFNVALLAALTESARKEL